MFKAVPVFASATAIAFGVIMSVPASAASFSATSPSPAASSLPVESAQLRSQQRQRIFRPLPPNPCRKTVCPR